MIERITSVDAPAVTDNASVVSITILLPDNNSNELFPGMLTLVISSTV